MFVENSEVKVISKTVGKEKRIIPLAMELEVKENSNLFNTILNTSNFEKFMDFELTCMYPGDKIYEKDQEFREQLRNDCKDANIKITIKIELEKYE